MTVARARPGPDGRGAPVQTRKARRARAAGAVMRRADDEVHRAAGAVSMAICLRHAHLAKPQAACDTYFAEMPDRGSPTE